MQSNWRKLIPAAALLLLILVAHAPVAFAQTNFGDRLGSPLTTSAENQEFTLQKPTAEAPVLQFIAAANHAVVELQELPGTILLAIPLAQYWKARSLEAAGKLASFKPAAPPQSLGLSAGIDGNTQAYNTLLAVLADERSCYRGMRSARAACFSGIAYSNLAEVAGKVPNSVAPAAIFYHALASAATNASADRPLSPQPLSLGSLPSFQGLVGVNVAGASASNASSALLAQLSLDLPIGNEVADQQTSDHLFWLWGVLRVGSVAPPANLAGLSANSLASPSTLAAAASLVQSIEASGGIEIQLKSWNLQHDVTSPAGSAAPPSSSHLTMSVIGGVGLLTPLSASNSASQAIFYQATPNLRSALGSYAAAFDLACAPTTPPSPCYVAFMSPDRTQFFQNWESGARLKFYVKDQTDGGWRFPGLIDFTVGQNQYVTGGQMAYLVSHTSVVFPLPLDSLYLTLVLDTRLTGRSSTTPLPLLLPPAAGAAPALTDADVVPVQIQPDRDRWAIGISFDIVDFVKKLKPQSASSGNQP